MSEPGTCGECLSLLVHVQCDQAQAKHDKHGLRGVRPWSGHRALLLVPAEDVLDQASLRGQTARNIARFIPYIVFIILECVCLCVCVDVRGERGGGKGKGAGKGVRKEWEK